MTKPAAQFASITVLILTGFSLPALAQVSPSAPPSPSATVPNATPPALSTQSPIAAPTATAATLQFPPPSTAPAPVAVAPTQPQVLPPPGYVLVPVGSTLAPAPEPQTEMPYESGQPIPAGYHVEERMRRGLVIAGSLTLGIPWVFSATAAVGNDFEDKSGFLMIPALGPWLMLATGGASDNCSTGTDYSNCTEKSVERAWLFLDGVTQTAGAILLATGLYYPSKRLIKDNYALSITPTTFGRTGYGLGAVGTF
jgi:hypothetical protein